MSELPMADVVRSASGETVLGYQVAAYRETHPLYGDGYGYRYSEHWSTPNTKHPTVKVERLFTEDQLRAAIMNERWRCAAIARMFEDWGDYSGLMETNSSQIADRIQG